MKYGKNIHIIGVAGTEGSALLDYLSQKYPEADFTAHDYSAKDEFLRHFKEAHIGMGRKEAVKMGKRLLEMPTVTFCFQDTYLDGIEKADTIFVPQSWYLYEQNNVLAQYHKKFCSITKLYFDLFPGKIIGVTGSNGKTTTTNLIADVMKKYHPSTLISGNDRRSYQVLDQIEEKTAHDWLVLEISNRQLMIDLGKSPDISVITNITPNHLSEYKNFEEYVGVKRNIFMHQTENQWAVLNVDDEESAKINEHHDKGSLLFSTEEVLSKGAYIQFENIVLKHADKETVVMSVNEFPLKGQHNLSNALATTAACHLAGVPAEEIAHALKNVTPVPQRMELVQEVQGVKYYNDSASTVPESTIAAVEALKEEGKNLTLIMGGKSKGSDYLAFVEKLKENDPSILLIKSPVADEIQALNTGELSIVVVDTLSDALRLAAESSATGDKVVLSPASEYFVFFRGKNDDYKMFRHLVKGLEG